MNSVLFSLTAHVLKKNLLFSLEGFISRSQLHIKYVEAI